MFQFKPDTANFAKYIQKAVSGLSDIQTNRDLSQGMSEAGEAYSRFIRNRFSANSQGAGQWVDLDIATKRKRFALYGSPTRERNSGKNSYEGAKFPILKATLRLFGSLSKGHSDNINIVNKTGIIVGSKTPYARYHQTGTSRMPARVILVKPDKEARSQIKIALELAFRRFFNGRSDQ